MQWGRVGLVRAEWGRVGPSRAGYKDRRSGAASGRFGATGARAEPSRAE